MLKLQNRAVGPGQPPYIIAEIGSNHNGDMALCRELVVAAAECGADAVKFQSWSKSSLISEAEFRRNQSYADTKRHFGSLREMVEAYAFTPEQHVSIAAYCQEQNVHFMSSAFSNKEVDLLKEVGSAAIKIASMDVTHELLLEHAASSGVPVILSTGMASLAEVARAAEILQVGDSQAALLHCVSIYPPNMRDIHLNNIPMLRQAFGLPVGFSDHTRGVAVPLASVALGACIIEKHFTLDKDMSGWDHWISADPPELRTLCEEAKNIYEALGSAQRSVSEAELKKRESFRRRAVVTRALKAGHKLSLEDLDFKRPGTGIHPNEYRYLLDRELKRDLAADTELEWNDLI